ncbi:MAG: type II toxin-antitoxin system ParD family antitoxin [Desulfurococcales archaeon]|nr:type II toxin-antitoxin system ParD family antitoxin [Desulfurococcales archaeon]
MVVTIELSGLLEERIRRLVDLGLYASVSEAVRDAIRRLLEDVNLRDIAVDLYLHRGATFQYATYIAGDTFESMLDYMISRGVVPYIGAYSEKDFSFLDKGVYLIDPLTLYVVYKTELVMIMDALTSKGYKFLLPSEHSGMLDVEEAKRVIKGMKTRRPIDLASIPLPKEPSRLPITQVEEGLVNYSLETGFVYMTDDKRTRDYASNKGATTIASVSLASTAYELGLIDEAGLEDIVLSLQSVPYALASEVYRGLGVGR